MNRPTKMLLFVTATLATAGCATGPATLGASPAPPAEAKLNPTAITAVTAPLPAVPAWRAGNVKPPMAPDQATSGKGDPEPDHPEPEHREPDPS